MRRFIFCGGRDRHVTPRIDRIVRLIWHRRGPFEPVHGGAIGMDRGIHKVFRSLGIECTVMEPKYEDYAPHERKQAPLDRNTAMAEYAGPDGVCIAFPGKGGGTWDMIEKALAVGMIVVRWNARTNRLERLDTSSVARKSDCTVNET